MMEVFPTDWSPKKTSLYLASGASEVPVEAVRLAVDGLDGVEVVDSLIVAIG